MNKLIKFPENRKTIAQLNDEILWEALAQAERNSRKFRWALAVIGISIFVLVAYLLFKLSRYL